MTVTKKPITHMPELSLREVIHRLRLWMAMRDVPRSSKAHVTITLPDRKSQLCFYASLVQELRVALIERDCKPMQTPSGAFSVELEDMIVIIANKDWSRD